MPETNQAEPNSTEHTDATAQSSGPQAGLAGKRILLGLSGGIACYKAAELCRALVKEGAQVQVVMSEAAAQFITPITMQALSGRPVYTSQWDSRADNNMLHIQLGRECDAILVAPASADFMAKLLHGRADDLLSLLILARPLERVPLILAPAMNREMWLHPATQRNIAQLKADGAHVLDVGTGEQACGEIGDGRMLEPDELRYDLDTLLRPKTLAGRRVLITAGPTYEAIDPVRGITNRSSGKMGFAIAQAAHQAGASVDLLSGPVALESPRGVTRYNCISAEQMLAAALPLAEKADIFIATAAVADWRPAHTASQKIKKDSASTRASTGAGGSALAELAFVENPDILAAIAHSPRAQRGQLYCVGFAAESENLLAHASAKRLRKGIPLLIGNIGPATFGQDHNSLLIVADDGHRTLPQADKLSLARQLIEEIAERIKAQTKLR